MKKSDLDAQKYLNNIEEFKEFVGYLRENEIILWRHLSVSGALSINTNRVYSCCANMRTQYKLFVWGTESTRTNGVFKPFHDLLEQIQFSFHG